MTQPTHSDIQRDLGGLEAGLDALKDVVRDGFRDNSKRFDRIDDRLANLEAKESSRSALEKAAVWLSGVIGAAAALIVEHVWK